MPSRPLPPRRWFQARAAVVRVQDSTAGSSEPVSRGNPGRIRRSARASAAARPRRSAACSRRSCSSTVSSSRPRCATARAGGRGPAPRRADDRQAAQERGPGGREQPFNRTGPPVPLLVAVLQQEVELTEHLGEVARLIPRGERLARAGRPLEDHPGTCRRAASRLPGGTGRRRAVRQRVLADRAQASDQVRVRDRFGPCFSYFFPAATATTPSRPPTALPGGSLAGRARASRFL